MTTENKPPSSSQPTPATAQHAPPMTPIEALPDFSVEPPAAADEPAPVDRLASLLAAIDRFIPETTTLAVGAAPVNEYRLLIQESGDSSARQMKKVTDYVRKLAARLSAAQRVELDEVLELQDGEHLVAKGIDVFGTVLGNGFFGKVVHWIVQHLIQIKKVLRMLVEWLADTFGMDWLEKIVNHILDIIDEKVNTQHALLASALGQDHARIARELSELEVNALHELTALAQLQAATAARR